MATTKTPATPTPAQDAAALAAHQAAVAKRRAARGYPEVGWNFEEVQPLSIEYVTRDSYLLITTLANTPGTIITVGARILLPDGKTKLCVWTSAATVSGSKTLTVQPLVEGFLLSVTVTAVPTTPPLYKGDTYVQVQLQYGATPAVNIYRKLIGGYVTTGPCLGWPEDVPVSSVDGMGVLTANTVGAPAAGADWSLYFSAFCYTQFLSASATLTTSSTAATRIPVIQLLAASGAIMWGLGPATGQAASTTVRYSIGAGGALGTDAAGNAFIAFPYYAMIEGNGGVKSVTTNLQSGDQWSAIQFSYITWVTP